MKPIFPLSYIHLQDVLFDVRLGWLAEERTLPQRVVLDIKLQFLKPPQACETDELSDTLCYGNILTTIKTRLDSNEFKLLEHLAYDMYQIIKAMADQPIRISVRVTKKLPIPDIEGNASFNYADEMYT